MNYYVKIHCEPELQYWLRRALKHWVKEQGGLCEIQSDQRANEVRVRFWPASLITQWLIQRKDLSGISVHTVKDCDWTEYSERYPK